jgi:hypothetical protein
MRYIPILCVGVLGLSIVLPGWAEDKPAEVSAKVKEKLGARTLAILSGATKVEVFRIDREQPNKDSDKKIGEYFITATGKEQGKDFVARLTPLLFDERTYFRSRPSRCHDPGVAYRLWKDKESVEILVCFHCKNLSVTAMAADGQVIQKAFGNFEDAMFGPLAKAAKEALPDDKDIQALPDNGEKP